jgi:glycosyltransferase involved in cell wall biosynthesis
MAYVLRRFASRVVAVSESTRDHHLHVARLQSERVIVIPNGTDLAPYAEISTATRAAIRAELAIPSDAPVIMTVAIQRSEKGLHHMVQAMPAVRARHPRAFYVLVGDGPERAALERQVALLKIADAVRFTGLRDDVAAMLSAADVFVQPSLSDALPTTLIEAMAAGVPAVGTNVGGIPEIISPGRTGVLVRPGSALALADAVLGLLDDARTARQFGAEARRVAFAHFDAGHAVRRLHDEYLDLAGRRS